MPIYFDSCSRCHGDVAIDRDMYGAFLDCLQCGSMPSQLVINRPNIKGNGISIDAHIETLWALDRMGKMSASSHDGLIKDEPLEKRLKDMGQHGYVAVALPDGKTDTPKNENYCITPKGREALDAYKVFVKTILEHPESKNAEISSYALVDEDGKLTLIGNYFVQASQVTARFVDDIYPMATLSTEHPETPEEPQESRAV